MLLLALTLVGGLFLSNYKLKQQFDKIDTSDPYWDYPIREAGKFHHVQIVGGNLFSTKIIKGNKSLVMRSEHLKDWLTADIREDTLFVRYAEHVPTTRKNEADPLSIFTVYIVMDSLKSLDLTECNVIVENNNYSDLYISAKKGSGVDIQKYKDGQSLKVNLADQSFFGIYNQDGIPLKLNRLDVSVYGKSNVIFNNVSTKSGSIRASNDSKITADAGLLKNLVVE